MARQAKSQGKSNSRKRVSVKSQQQQQPQQSEDVSSMARAREFVESNANLQTAGIALAGAGILALVSTQAGRSLLKTASDTIIDLVSSRFGQNEESEVENRQRPSRQRDQARA